MTKTDKIVLGTVNTPFKKSIGVDTLVASLKDESAAIVHAPYLSVFFGEIYPPLQESFVKQHKISKAQLLKTCKKVASFSGEKYPLLTNI